MISFPVGFLILFGIFLIVRCTDVGYRGGDRDRCNRTVDIYHTVSSPPVTEKNVGRPVHCSYRIRVRPAREDWIVFVRFTKLKVGEPSAGRRNCDGGFLQIVDGFRDNNQTNKDSPGYYCGEIDSPKTFISETPYVKIVFHVESYDLDTYMQFDASVEQQQEVHARYGQYPHLYPHRRGLLVPGTYCERNFQDCAPGRCFVQSPGFPGIYPRNLHCRYRVTVPQGLAGLDLITFDVDGLRCDNLLLCFPRSVTRDPNDCPYDYVRVYDGLTEDSPVIVTLCGRGRLKSNVVASGPRMLVEFVTSATGPLLNTGFHFKADNMLDVAESQPLRLREGSCAIERHLQKSMGGPTGSGPVGSGGQPSWVFSNLRSWYPGNTTCFYRFFAGDDEIIRLEFLWFRIERPTTCREWLKIYDGHDPDPTKILTKLCDNSRPRTDPPRNVYESTGNVLLVRFFSSIGSLDGSSISYGFEVKSLSLSSPSAVSAQSTEQLCSKVFSAYESLSGTFTFPIKQSNNSNSASSSSTNGGGGVVQHLVRPHSVDNSGGTYFCNATFNAASLTHGRVSLTIYAPFTKMTSRCDDCRETGNVYLQFSMGEEERAWSRCLCQIGEATNRNMVSLDSIASVTLHVPPHAGGGDSATAFPNGGGVVRGSYNFFSDSRCGPIRFDLGLQGVFSFPFHSVSLQGPGYCNDEPCSLHHGTAAQGGPLRCVWKVPVYHDMDLAFRLEGFPDARDCEDSEHSLRIGRALLCPSTQKGRVEHLIHRDDLGSEVTIDFTTADSSAVNFTLWWTLVNILPGSHESDSYVSLDKDCEFLCPTSFVCLKKELVCNGVVNCPGGTASDEDRSVCAFGDDSFKLYWWVIGVGIGLCACVVLCIVFSLCKRYQAGRRRFK